MTKKISQLPAATSVDTNDEFVINQDGTTKKVTTANQWDFANVTIDGGSITGITDLAVADGGTGASDAGTARTNLGLGNVDNVSAANLRDRSTHTGTQPLSTISDAGNMGLQNKESVNIDGGTIDGTAVNATTLTASGNVDFDSGTLFVDASENRVGIGTTSPGARLHVATPDPATDFSVIDFRNPDFGIYAKSNAISARGNTLEFTATDFNSGSGAITRDLLTLRPEGNVGIGTTEPSADSRLTVSKGSNAGLVLRNTTAADRLRIFVGDGTDGYANDTNYIASNNTPLIFIAGNPADATAERMRIDSSGNVGIGTTSPSSTATRLSVSQPGGAGDILFVGTVNNTGACIRTNVDFTDARTHMRFTVGATTQGSIVGSGTSVSYNTSSDYRLKENIQPLTGALDKVQTMNPVTYDWKAGGEGEGFIAHELQEIAPYAVSGEKDGEDMQGVDYGKLTTLLVGAVKELTAKVEQLEAQIGANNGN